MSKNDKSFDFKLLFKGSCINNKNKRVLINIKQSIHLSLKDDGRILLRRSILFLRLELSLTWKSKQPFQIRVVSSSSAKFLPDALWGKSSPGGSRGLYDDIRASDRNARA